MHVLVPFASDASEACLHVLRDLALPHLERLLARLSPVRRDDAARTSLSPPHERALAAARGWRGDDGALPFAAHAARADGIDVAGQAWAMLTPVHWQLGRDHVTLLDPDDLGLGEVESHALLDALRDLLTSEGFVVAWGAATRWYVGRDDLEGVATASPDRVIGRNVDFWLAGADRQRSPAARAIAALLPRLQSEAQLVFHVHAVNEAREERGELTANSFWLSGCGRAQGDAGTGAEEPMQVGELRKPWLDGDWAAWAEAWQSLDAGLVAELEARVASGESLTLTLCGERSAARFESAGRSWLERVRSTWRRPEAHTVLAGL